MPNIIQLRPVLLRSPPVAVGGLVAITDPTELSGLQIWLDGADGATFSFSSSNLISIWGDKSVNNRDVFNGTAGSTQPLLISSALNGKSVVRFDGTQTLNNQTDTGMFQGISGWSIFVVGKSTTGAGTYFFVGVSGGSARGSMGVGETTNGHLYVRGRRQDVDSGVSVESSTDFGTGYGYFSALANYTTTTAQIYHNGTLGNSSSSWLTSGVTDSDNGYIGAGSIAFGDASFLTGDIAEVFAYNSSQAANRTRIELYLKNKWGL